MSMLLLLVILVTFGKETVAVDLCSKENSSVLPQYRPSYEVTQNCGCERNCIRKCCKPGYNLGRRFCFENTSEPFIVPIYTDKTKFVYELDKDYSMKNFIVGTLDCYFFRLNYPEEEFYLQSDGSAWVPMYQKFFENYEYCIDELDGFTPFMCFPDEDLPPEREVNVIGMIISMPFLLVTFLVYAILPESNIHRRSLMCYVLSLLIGYIFLVSIQLNNNFIETFWCHFLGYGIIFFFICSFFWMNVMCIDMWLAFSGLRGFKGKRSTERKRFLAYFAYAVGMPLLLIFIVFLMNTYADEDSIFHPKLGGARCFVEEGYPNLFYFSLPMAIILLINVILFILTSVRIQQVKKETSMLKQSDSKRHTYEEEKQKFNLYLKLSLAMGINWIMEVISWAVGWKLKTVPAYIWYLTDFTNAAYGVLIFFIFVFKRKIWVGLKKKYYVFIGKPHLAHTLSTSHPARTSNYSTTDTAVSTDYRLSDVKNGKGEDRPLSRN